MKTNIKGIKIFKSKIFYDNRGSFKEVYKKNLLPNKKLIFDCMSNSKKNVLLGVAQCSKFTYSSPQRPDKYIFTSLAEVGVAHCGPN